ncbi:unnamed protein product, partial [marine sediment metagenome]
YDKVPADIRVDGLYNMGLTAPNPIGAFVSRYDTVAGRYAVLYSPVKPIGFREDCTVYIKAPSDRDLTIYSYSDLLVVITNLDEFIESLHEIAGVEKPKLPELFKRPVKAGASHE